MKKAFAGLAALSLLLGVIRLSAAASRDTDTQFFQDLIITLLEPSISSAVDSYYADRYVEQPGYEPSMSEVTEMHRAGGDRSFHFFVEVEVQPYFGPHLTVGRDRIACEVRFGEQPKVLSFEHLEDHELPEHYRHLYK